jgi:hypothetical protein
MGLDWLVAQQNPDGSWGVGDQVGKTGLALVKLEERAFELGYDPFDPDYEYSENVIAGLDFIFSEASVLRIVPQPAGDPDTNGNGIGVQFGWGTYETGIAMMAIASSRAPNMVIATGPLGVLGRQYRDVLQDAVDYFAFGQCDAPNPARGGWGYGPNEGWAENSNSGYAVLGLAYAESPFFGFECTIPDFLKEELNIWIDYIQNDVDGDPADGGSGYEFPDDWVNVLKTGNLIFQMVFVGDPSDPPSPRMQDALDYLGRLWDDTTPDPGWKWDWPPGQPHYQAMYCIMKGLTFAGIPVILDGGAVERDWYLEFAEAIVSTQKGDGSWPGDWWGDPILSAGWALLTLEAFAPPPPVIPVAVDIKPTSCRNPFNVGKKGVLPAAILGTEDFDPKEIDPASILIGPEGGEAVPPIRWALEDVATPYDGKPPDGSDAYACTDEGPDGFMDLTLKFDAQEVAAALGPVNDDDIMLLSVVGNLREELGGTAIKGVDVIQILKKGKGAPAAPTIIVAGLPTPQPSNPDVWVPYRLGQGVAVKITIYSISGHLVRSLDLGYRPAGDYSSRGKAAYWDGKNEAGELVSSGIYFYIFQAGDYVATRKLVMIK